MASPYQYGFARNLVDKIDEAQLLPYPKFPRHDSKAPFRANVDGVALRAQGLASIGPLNRYRHARIESPAAANTPHPGIKTCILQERHGRLLDTRGRGQRSPWARHSFFGNPLARADVNKLNNIISLRVFLNEVNGTSYPVRLRDYPCGEGRTTFGTRLEVSRAKVPN